MFKKIKKTLFFIFIYPLIQGVGYIIIFLLLFLSQKINLKLAYARTDRIGELLPQFAAYLRLKNKPIGIWYFTKPFCNNFLVKKVKQSVICWPFGKDLFDFCFKKIKNLKPSLLLDINAWCELDKIKTVPRFLKFSNKELKHGNRVLETIFKSPNKGFVCLIIRDNKYLTNIEGNESESKHFFRNTDPKKYFAAIKYLTKKKYFVFRMGKNQKPFHFTDPLFFDYASSEIRSDFLDIFLGLKCKFCISTNCGWDLVPNLGKRPILYLNYYPLAYLPSFMKKCSATFQKIFCQKRKRLLKISEIFDRKVYFAMSKEEAYRQSLIIKQSSSKENLEVVKEFFFNIQSKKQLSSFQSKLQKMFWKSFDLTILDESKTFRIHSKVNLQISEKFLRRNLELVRPL